MWSFRTNASRGFGPTLILFPLRSPSPAGAAGQGVNPVSVLLVRRPPALGAGELAFLPHGPRPWWSLLGAQMLKLGATFLLVSVSHCKVLFSPVRSLLGGARGCPEASVALCGGLKPLRSCPLPAARGPHSTLSVTSLPSWRRLREQLRVSATA